MGKENKLFCHLLKQKCVNKINGACGDCNWGVYVTSTLMDFEAAEKGLVQEEYIIGWKGHENPNVSETTLRDVRGPDEKEIKIIKVERGIVTITKRPKVRTKRPRKSE